MCLLLCLCAHGVWPTPGCRLFRQSCTGVRLPRALLHYAVQVYNFEDFKKALAEKKRILAPWVPDNSVEEGVKKMTRVDGDAETGEGMMAGAKTLCIPFEQPDMPKGQKCIFAEALNNKSLDATCFALWGRSY